MHRVIAAFRLLIPTLHEPGPLKPSSDSEVSSEDIGEFLSAIYIAVEKIRAFGLEDDDFGGDIKIVKRKSGERANGRYYPKGDKTVVYYPQVRGAPDLPWTIVHEVMHRIWVKHISNEAKEVWGLLCDSTGKEIDDAEAEAMSLVVKNSPDKSSLWFYFKKHFGDDLGVFKQWLKTRRVSDSFPSQYASADPAEAFSEVAANMILGRAHAGKELRRSGSMVRKVFLSLLGPLRATRRGRMFEDIVLEQQQDENFLQTQVDFGYLRAKIPNWVAKNIPERNIIKLEHRPHVTVYYGADKRDREKIEKVVLDYGRPIRAMLGEFDTFEHDEHDVLFIKIIGDSFKELNKRIGELPHSRPSTHPVYKPHLTVAYLKKGTGRKYIGITPFRMVVSARGITVIDAVGIERIIRAVPITEREPLLLADR